MITEPVPEVLEKIGWTGGEAITDGRALVHYFRTTPDGRIAFGWGGGRIAMGARLHGRTEVDAGVIAAQIRHLHEYFPDLIGRRITDAWGGPIDAWPTHLPAVTSLPRGRAWVAAGYTGNGVGPTNMVGLTLVEGAVACREVFGAGEPGAAARRRGDVFDVALGREAFGDADRLPGDRGRGARQDGERQGREQEVPSEPHPRPAERSGRCPRRRSSRGR